MAKFNITIDLDWMDEEGGIDESVKQEIINNITAKVSADITDEITKEAEEKIQQSISDTIDDKVNSIIDTLLNRKFDVTDKWGDIKQKNVSVIDLFKQRMDDYFSEHVDSDGRVISYGGQTRLNYLISRNIDYNMKNKIEKAAAEIKYGLENYIDTTIKAQIGENVAKAIGLDKITAKLGK